ncbi:hypothetical protein SCLCIDRAFT_497314 [Scleroderma citrinum Foug A]|uniref:Uncharacterized protein n=1 Tax=Scleroderma citrinum Foug A TaxID=1036808 RepID=A0A0C3A8F4_9AGAM|nr:hypothetical protein SCLCIDRAFT_497314 [Scleroderma citrinum Foug A]
MRGPKHANLHNSGMIRIQMCCWPCSDGMHCGSSAFNDGRCLSRRCVAKRLQEQYVLFFTGCKLRRRQIFLFWCSS